MSKRTPLPTTMVTLERILKLMAKYDVCDLSMGDIDITRGSAPKAVEYTPSSHISEEDSPFDLPTTPEELEARLNSLGSEYGGKY